ncbi:MAG TPA: hypothetical protein VGR27_08735 [Longimicrobiaceae bacterium]|nr:hypothetical protein [Longimicrobiaceae bacterium]
MVGSYHAGRRASKYGDSGAAAGRRCLPGELSFDESKDVVRGKLVLQSGRGWRSA